MKEITKLHKQFGHPSCKRLIQLLKTTGETDQKYFKGIEEITTDCDIIDNVIELWIETGLGGLFNKLIDV